MRTFAICEKVGRKKQIIGRQKNWKMDDIESTAEQTNFMCLRMWKTKNRQFSRFIKW